MQKLNLGVQSPDWWWVVSFIADKNAPLYAGVWERESPAQPNKSQDDIQGRQHMQHTDVET